MGGAGVKAMTEITWRRTMRYPLLASLAVSAVMAGQAFADLQTAQRHVPDAELVGEGRLKYLFWSVFDAALYAPDGIWSADQPFALSLSYLRDLEGEGIVEASIDEIREQGMADQAILERWRDEMTAIFPDVDDQTTLTGIVDDNSHTQFYQNGELVGTISDPAFSRYFFNIWLGEQTSEPKLRRQLLGRGS